MRILVASLVSIVAAGTVACGQSGGDAAPDARSAPGATPQQRAAQDHDLAVDRANSALRQAAAEKDRPGVLRAQRQLDALARDDPGPQSAGPGGDDAYAEVIGTLRFKQAPLYVQQVATSDSDHRAFVAVFAEQFCLLTTEARTQAARAVYEPLERRMRAQDVTDFELVLVPLSESAPTRARALAVGRDGRLALTARGRAC